MEFLPSDQNVGLKESFQVPSCNNTWFYQIEYWDLGTRSLNRCNSARMSAFATHFAIFLEILYLYESGSFSLPYRKDVENWADLEKWNAMWVVDKRTAQTWGKICNRRKLECCGHMIHFRYHVEMVSGIPPAITPVWNKYRSSTCNDASLLIKCLDILCWNIGRAPWTFDFTPSH